MEELVQYNLLYFLFAFCLIYPPDAITLIGLSIPTLFSSILGSEQLLFIHYQIVRICTTVFIHSLLPLGYYLFIGYCLPDFNLFEISSVGILWKIYLSFSILFAIGLSTLVFYWKMNNYSNHPIAVFLSRINSNRNWKQLANEINIEFRRVDKFTTGTCFYNRIIVTDNWLIKINLYSLNICHHDSFDLVLTHSTELNLTMDGAPSCQLLNILVKPRNNFQKPFYIKLNSLEYKDFNDKINKPIESVNDIIIKQSLPDQFLDSFQNQVYINRSLKINRDQVETCIGCMKKLANVKLVKMCNDESNECQSCSCRPMWCLECMGKWFAYRQDQSSPNTWLSGKATCATCRATFCMLDVCLLEFND